LRVQAILGFLEHERAFAFEDILRNFLTTMRSPSALS